LASPSIAEFLNHATSDRFLLFAAAQIDDLRLALALAPKASRGDMQFEAMSQLPARARAGLILTPMPNAPRFEL
jgi:hypothetical protein